MSKNLFLREYNSPNIVIEPTKIIPHAPMTNQHTAKSNYFNKYESPNIVIVPTATVCSPPSPKRIKLDTIPPKQSPELTDISFLDDFNIDEIVACLNNCDNIQQTETGNEINQAAQFEPIEQKVLNKDDLIKPHEDFINNDTNMVDNINYSLKPVENKNLTTIKINAYEFVEKSNNTILEKIKNAQNNIRNTETPSDMVPCESVKHKKERTKLKPENDIDNCIIININVNLVVNSCRGVKKSLRSKRTTENKTIIKHEHTESEISVAKTLTDITPIEKKKGLEGEHKITIHKTSSVEQKNLDETQLNKDIIPFEKKNLEGESKATVDITFIKENIKLEEELATGEVTAIDITPIKENEHFASEPKTSVNITVTKENNFFLVKPIYEDISSMQENKTLEVEPNTTIDIKPIKEVKKLEDKPKDNEDITFKKENIKLEGELTTADMTAMKDNKNVVGEPKIIVAKSSIQENKRLEIEPNSTVDKSFIKELEVVDKPPMKQIETTIDDEKIFKTEVNKPSIASATTDVLEFIKLEHQMHNFLHKKFSVLSVIHRGNYSKIFKCKDSIGEHYAVKMLNKKNNILHGSSKEIMLKNIQLDIPKKNLFCTYLYESFAFNGHWCFLLDYYPKNLNQAIEESGKPFNINTTQELASQLAGAVLLLRNNSIVHSDIKPNHILLNSTNTKLKLCGFDNAYYLNDNTLSNIGALYYRPPEVILGCPPAFSSDVWSTALVLYEMVTGTVLFPGYSNSDMLYRQMKLLGSIPEELLSVSLYRNKYFYKDQFLKLSYHNKVQKSISISYFTGGNTILNTVYRIYIKHWGIKEHNKDEKKLVLFLNLLEQMLVLYPKRRLSIEFVCANPFIYELFSN